MDPELYPGGMDVTRAREIIVSVAKLYELRVTDLRAPSRMVRVRWPRQVASYLLRKLTNFSYPQIGQFLGQHHSTVMHSYDIVGKRMAEDPRLRGAIRKIEAEVCDPPR